MELSMTEEVVTTGAIRHAKLWSKSSPPTNQHPTFTGRMPFLLPNQQCQSTEGTISHSMDLLTPSLPGGLPTLWPLKLLVTLGEGCHASHQPFDASTPSKWNITTDSNTPQTFINSSAVLSFPQLVASASGHCPLLLVQLTETPASSSCCTTGSCPI